MLRFMAIQVQKTRPNHRNNLGQILTSIRAHQHQTAAGAEQLECWHNWPQEDHPSIQASSSGTELL